MGEIGVDAIQAQRADRQTSAQLGRAGKSIQEYDPSAIGAAPHRSSAPALTLGA